MAESFGSLRLNWRADGIKTDKIINPHGDWEEFEASTFKSYIFKKAGKPNLDTARESVEAARAVGSVKAAKPINMVHPIIEGLQSSGIDTLTGLADALNERGIKTGQGSHWHPPTVKRVIEARATPIGSHWPDL